MGEVRLPANLVVWKHELTTAQALAAAGYEVLFVSATAIKGQKSPDIIMFGVAWEIKSPRTNRLSSIERNLKRAAAQSCNIIIDSQRVNKLHDKSVQVFLAKKFQQQKTIQRLLFVNKQRKVIDISKLAS